ncbi:MAG: MarR family transcriptional regulator [Myxococcales bacterium]|nr:MarR family transcriptional regulator [Myxococcales bacterium]
MPADPADQLRRAMQQVFRRFGVLAGDATPCGQPLSMAHAHALLVLRERGALAQRDLARELGIDKSNVARLCARLAALDHATLRTAAHDRRVRLVQLTPRGARVADVVDGASRARFTSLLAAVPAARRSPLIAALELLAAVLAPAAPVAKGLADAPPDDLAPGPRRARQLLPRTGQAGARRRPAAGTRARRSAGRARRARRRPQRRARRDG